MADDSAHVASTPTSTGSKGGKKISNRHAFKVVDGKRIRVTDYTEATVARYEYLGQENVDNDSFVPTAIAEMDFQEIEHDGKRACAIDGFLNKAGHTVNKVVNSKMKFTYDQVKTALAEYQELIEEGGWTSGTGEGFAGLSLIWEAIYRSPASQAKGYTLDQIKAAWPTFPEERQQQIRRDEGIKRMVAEIRLERQRAKEQAAGGSSVLTDFTL